MHGVNLDLLCTLPHHPDGRPKDPHAHHRAEHLAALQEEKAPGRRSVLAQIIRSLRFPFVDRKVRASCS